MADTTQTTVDDFISAPVDVKPLDSRIDDVKAEKVYNLAVTPGGVTNGKVYPNTEDADFKSAKRDLVKHVSSRLNDGHVAKVITYRAGDGISFKVVVKPKSNRGRKPDAKS